MVATRDVSALEVLLTEEAAAVGPKLQHSWVCVECLADLNSTDCSLVFCSKCRLPFCSAHCRASSKLHSLECSVLAKCQPQLCREDFTADTAVLASVSALRLLALRKHNPSLYRRVDLLMDNVDKIR